MLWLEKLDAMTWQIQGKLGDYNQNLSFTHAFFRENNLIFRSLECPPDCMQGKDKKAKDPHTHTAETTYILTFDDSPKGKWLAEYYLKEANYVFSGSINFAQVSESFLTTLANPALEAPQRAFAVSLAGLIKPVIDGSETAFEALAKAATLPKAKGKGSWSGGGNSETFAQRIKEIRSQLENPESDLNKVYSILSSISDPTNRATFTQLISGK
jgi:hypothetical protein